MSIASDKIKLAVLQVTIDKLVPLRSPIRVFDLMELVMESLAEGEESVGDEFYRVIHLLTKIGFVTNSHHNEKVQETTFGDETTVCPNVSIRSFLEDQRID
jgi:hypothetical protein